MAEAEKKRDLTFSQVILSKFSQFHTPNLIIYHYHPHSTFCDHHYPHIFSLSVSAEPHFDFNFFLRFCDLILIMVISQEKDDEKDLDLGPDEHESPLPLTVTSRVNFSDPGFWIR